MPGLRRLRTLATPGLAIFLSTLLVYSLCLNGVWSADHPTSLLEPSYSLWANHSVVLGKAGEFHPQGGLEIFDAMTMAGNETPRTTAASNASRRKLWSTIGKHRLEKI